MRVFIAGIDGYLGWSLALHLAKHGHDVGGADCYLRRDWVAEVGSHSAIPIARMTQRIEAFTHRFGKPLQFYRGNLTDYAFVENSLRAFRPDAIVHLGEMPSAPYSMIGARHAVDTHVNNLVGTLNILFVMRDYFPQCHMLKLGTMGEFGTPGIAIPEGSFQLRYKGGVAWLPFPRSPGSYYHCTKVHDSTNIALACRVWNLRATDIMQGVVYGTLTDEIIPCRVESWNYTHVHDDLCTRFDFDGTFGTAINRFCAQAVIGHPITPYGRGGQKRGFLPLRDSVQCMRLLLENPPGTGEYREVNQLEDTYTINQLAGRVLAAANWLGMKAEIRHTVNPRAEQEDHFYKVEAKILKELGYKSAITMAEQIVEMLNHLGRHRGRIEARKHLLLPDVRWSGHREPVGYIRSSCSEEGK